MATALYPKLHNATWPGVVGKGSDSEPAIGLDTMMDLTAAAEVGGVRFDGVDLFLSDPHVSIDSTDADLEALAEKARSRGLAIGSLVAPVWGNVGGGSAMGTAEERDAFVTQVRKAARIGKALRDLGVRPYGVVRVDSSVDPATWAADPEGNTKAIAETIARACDAAAEFDEKVAAEGEVCWGGMHNWKDMLELLQSVNRPNFGFQADMAHTLLYLLGTNAPEARIVPEDFDWSDPVALDEGLRTLTSALRPWTIDFHVAQNDATVHGTGSHDKTGRHCLPLDPNGKLDIVRHAGYWLRDEHGKLTKAFRHICWDGCMFSNDVMLDPATWNQILAAMIDVRNAHGWSE